MKLRSVVLAAVSGFLLPPPPSRANAPGPHSHLIDMANVEFRKGHTHSAMRIYGQAAKIAPQSAAPQAGMGTVLAELGYARRALKRYDKAARLCASCAFVYRGRATIRDRLGHPRAALADYDRAVSISPSWAPAWAERAALLDRMGRPREALESWNRASRLDPAYAQSYGDARLAIHGRRPWPLFLAVVSALAALCFASARRVDTRLTGVEVDDRQAAQRTKGVCALAVSLLVSAAFVALMLPGPIPRAVGIKPAGPASGLGLFLASYVLLLCVLETAYSQVETRIRGVSISWKLAFFNGLRGACLCLVPMVAYQAVLAAASVAMILTVPTWLLEELPSWLFGCAGATVGLGAIFLLMPHLLRWTMRASRVASGPAWEAVRDACGGALPRTPSVYLAPESAQGRVVVAATLGGRIFVSSNALELLSGPEVSAVVKHEAGHLSHRHPLRVALVYLGLVWAVIAAAALTQELLPGLDSAWMLPVLSSLIGLGLLAAITAVARRNEHAADAFAVEHGADPEALLSALEKIHRHNLIGRRWAWFERWFATHPDMASRAAAIRASA